VQTTLLRRVLEPWGVATYLDRGRLVRADVDLDHLRAAIARGDAAAVASRYREPLAPGVDLPLIDEARGVLRAQVVALWKGAAATAADAVAIGLLERVLDVEPLDEPALADLLVRLVRGGRRLEARRRFDGFAGLVARELGVAPSPSTVAALGPP
jgi:DNA-binding SARP family transcriptional activator